MCACGDELAVSLYVAKHGLFYMTLFKKYNSQQLKALEWKYHLLCYGVPFIIALTLIFIETTSRGRVYGPAIVGQN
jgi:hypothetical protein